MGNCTALCAGTQDTKEGGKEFQNGSHAYGANGMMSKEKVEQEYENAKAMIESNFELNGLNLEQ